MDKTNDLIDGAKAVLNLNDQGSYTVPSRDLYPHQWLWDSCFIAIGMANYDIDRAQQEILSLIKGQWSNGMIPNVIFQPDKNAVHKGTQDSDIWNSWVSPYSPDNLETSGITQPPMLAEAVVRIGKKLSLPERRSWYGTVYPALIAYHSWMYAERDPHSEGLILLIHPWECGLDNTPPWMSELHSHLVPWWIRLINKMGLSFLVNLIRRDTRHISANERPSAVEELTMYSVQRRLRRKAYEIDKILPHSLFTIEDLVFNSILIRANQHLVDISKTLKLKLPEDLVARMKTTEAALDQLWDPYSNEFFSRNFITHDLIKEPSIAGLMPLYAGTVNDEKVEHLIKMLSNKRMFGTSFPVASTPVNSPWFREKNYWQGATWVATNWLIIDGLKRSGYGAKAEDLTVKTLEMVRKSGFFEYFSPLTGEAAGTDNFSWSAALTIELLSNSK